MRRWLIGGAIAAGVALLALLILGPGIAERAMNRIEGPMVRIGPAARALHARLAVVDLHADPLLWKRDLNAEGTRGHSDVPRLIAGRSVLQVFGSVTKTPKGQNYDSNPADTDNITLLAMVNGQPVRTWRSLLERALYHSEKLHRFAAASDGRLRVIRTAADLDRLLADRARGRVVLGGLLALEGLHPIEGDLTNLDRLHAAGFRIGGLTHFFDNEVAGSMHGEAKGGLTPLGVQALRRMEQLGMIVDVAHASRATVADVLRRARRPVISSHGGVQATCGVNRNLTDAELRGIAGTGGVVGIGYWDAAVCGTSPAKIVAAIAHVRDVAGIDHVALGSDFDGAVTTRFDASEVAAVTQALLDRGFTPGDIAKVMGGNALRVIRAGIVPAAPAS